MSEIIGKCSGLILELWRRAHLTILVIKKYTMKPSPEFKNHGGI